MQEFHTPEAIERLQGRLTRLLVRYYSDPEGAPVLPYRPRQELVDQFVEPHPPKSGAGFDATFAELEEDILASSVKTWHPLFLNQMNAGAPLPAVLGDAVAAMMNSTLATWEMTPVATIIERNVAGWLAELIGMPTGSNGIFLPGGSIANLLALTVARNRKLGPGIATDGILGAGGAQGAIVCSEGSHYSIRNAANLLGIGTANVIRVAVNDRGEMLASDLARKLDDTTARGQRPFVVVATVGITVTGGVDPVAEIAAICRQRDLHLHVDAAFGGTLALTHEAETRLAGIEQADTVLWDAHKWLHVPLSCSVLLAPDPQVLKESLTSDASYLFRPQDEQVAMTDDLGRYTLMCGKRFDALQVWVMLRALGVDYFRGLAERSLALTKAVYERLDADPDFRPCYEPVTPIVCFRYGDDEDGERSDALHLWVREEIKRRRLGMFNIARVGGRQSFRLVLINPLTELHHIDELLTHIRELADQKRRE